MFKLIREYLTSAILMHKATERSFDMSYKNSEKNIEYIDNRINHDLILQEKELEYWARKMKAEFENQPSPHAPSGTHH